jgi:membrane protein YdbS with pleckstrin-like domain
MGMNAISLILPVVYLLIASGIAYMLHLWLKVFPANPVARSLGIIIIMLAVFLTSIYQTRSYFVAWRYNSETSEVFRNKF